MFSLASHTAIVTGGAGGIGAATARALVDRGANVVIADIDDAAARRVVDELGARGAEAVSVRTDVTVPADVERVVSAATERFGSLEILMHFAGIGVERLALETTLEEWQRIIAVNLTGTFLMAQAAARVMVEAGYGRIVTMASVAGIRGGTGRTAYSASKGGVIAMTKVLALELVGRGVTVNALAPGAIETELVARMHDEETRRAYLRGIPAGRYGTPEEVAAAAIFLATPEASYINGDVMTIDGGFVSSGVMKNR